MILNVLITDCTNIFLSYLEDFVSLQLLTFSPIIKAVIITIVTVLVLLRPVGYYGAESRKILGDRLKLDYICCIPKIFQLIIHLYYYPMPYRSATESVMNVHHIVSQINKSVFFFGGSGSYLKFLLYYTAMQDLYRKLRHSARQKLSTLYGILCSHCTRESQ
jgi:hypothetical protein